jgi:hypothetical protein
MDGEGIRDEFAFLEKEEIRDTFAGMGWETMMDAYTGRFGDVVDVPLLGREKALRLFVLVFGSAWPAGTVTYASFGATWGPAGNEIFLTSLTPYYAFEHAVKQLAAQVPRDLRPLGVVHHEVEYTLFDSMLVVPERDGTFVLGEVEGAVRHALRLVPITPAERQLATRDPERLLDLLRAQRALVADPLRGCVVEPESDGVRRANAAALLHHHQRKVRERTERYERMVAKRAPDVFLYYNGKSLNEARATLAYLEAHVPAILPEPDAPELLDKNARKERLEALLGEYLGRSFDPYAPLAPRRVAQIFCSFLVIALFSHPFVEPVTDQAVMGPGVRPARAHEHEEHKIRVLGFEVAAQLAKDLSLASPQALEKRAEEVVAEARRAFASGADGSWRLYAWSALVPAVCMTAADLGPLQGPAAEHALRHATQLLAHVDHEPELGSGPAPTRLARIVSAVTRDLFLEYQRASRRARRERAARP